MRTTELLRRNAALVGGVAAQDRSIVPALRTVVLTCADHRVDPAHVLGIGLGDAIVLRNPGGRLTSSVLQDLLVLATVAAVEDIAIDFEFVIMHHTDCGLSRLDGPEHASLISTFVGVDASQSAELEVADPVLSVQYDVARLTSLGVLSPATQVVGLVLDLETGQVRQHAANTPATEADTTSV